MLNADTNYVALLQHQLCLQSKEFSITFGTQTQNVHE